MSGRSRQRRRSTGTPRPATSTRPAASARPPSPKPDASAEPGKPTAPTPATPASTESGPPADPEATELRQRRWDFALRVAGAVIAVWGGVLLGLYGAFLTPLRVGTVFLPVSLVLAVGGNLALIWFGYTVTRNRLLAFVPSLIWVVLSFVLSTRTTEGDLVLVDSNWVAVVYLLAGSVTIGVAAYRMILPRRK